MSPILMLLIAAAPGPAPAAWSESPLAATESPAAGDFERRVIALELALSSVVSERPSLWRFERLEAEAAELLRLAPDEGARRSVRDLADRLDRFARIGARHRAARDGQLVWRSGGGQAPAPTSRVAPPVQLTKAPAQPTSKHDAVGVLRPVVSKRPDAPKYGVVDENGRLATLVTPSPEVAERFDAMVGKRVALDGRRGFLTDLRRAHLVAERITPLAPIRR